MAQASVVESSPCVQGAFRGLLCWCEVGAVVEHVQVMMMMMMMDTRWSSTESSVSASPAYFTHRQS